jgi:hypothetical protein
MIRVEFRLICDGDECNFRTTARLRETTLLELAELAGWKTLNGRMYCPMCIANMIPYDYRSKIDLTQAALPKDDE